jgi:hypothetical protein
MDGTRVGSHGKPYELCLSLHIAHESAPRSPYTSFRRMDTRSHRTQSLLLGRLDHLKRHHRQWLVQVEYWPTPTSVTEDPEAP